MGNKNILQQPDPFETYIKELPAMNDVNDILPWYEKWLKFQPLTKLLNKRNKQSEMAALIKNAEIVKTLCNDHHGVDNPGYGLIQKILNNIDLFIKNNDIKYLTMNNISYHELIHDTYCGYQCLVRIIDDILFIEREIKEIIIKIYQCAIKNNKDIGEIAGFLINKKASVISDHLYDKFHNIKTAEKALMEHEEGSAPPLETNS